ncbi:MAG TPA: Fur family transcriptional regulator [Syntrophales bacterium]|nr:Fur family transcriptional regulator [Syntrophales bacterium]
MFHELTKQKLKEAGLKMTGQRKTILAVLEKIHHFHPSVSSIHGEARKELPSLSLSTVYATIEELRQRGLLQLLGFDGAESRCETRPGDHVHLVCKGCGEILDYPIPISIDREYIARHQGFVITGNRLEYYGLCKECCERQAEASRGAAYVAPNAATTP